MSVPGDFRRSVPGRVKRLGDKGESAVRITRNQKRRTGRRAVHKIGRQNNRARAAPFELPDIAPVVDKAHRIRPRRRQWAYIVEFRGL